MFFFNANCVSFHFNIHMETGTRLNFRTRLLKEGARKGGAEERGVTAPKFFKKININGVEISTSIFCLPLVFNRQQLLKAGHVNCFKVTWRDPKQKCHPLALML